METECSDPLEEALFALLAVVTADLDLSESLSLFVGDPSTRPASEASCGEAMIKTVDWCIDLHQRRGRSPREGETLAQVVAAEVLRQARAIVAAASPREAEAFFLHALALIVDEFCALWQAAGMCCDDTPLPTLRHALTTSLVHDYAVGPGASEGAGAVSLAAAHALANSWRCWAGMPHVPAP